MDYSTGCPATPRIWRDLLAPDALYRSKCLLSRLEVYPHQRLRPALCRILFLLNHERKYDAKDGKTIVELN